MPMHAEKRVLPYTPAQLFDLVADVEKYPVSFSVRHLLPAVIYEVCDLNRKLGLCNTEKT